jgi:drug/metabolite transporter, DME family
LAAPGESAVPGPAARPRPLVGAALVLGAASFWASLGIFSSHLYAAGFAPLELASVRAAVGFAAVAAWAVSSASRRARAIAVGWSAMPFLAAYGVLGYALFTLTFFAALQLTTVSIAVALLYTAPAFVLLLSAVLWRERIGGLRLLALALVLLGVALVTGALNALRHGVVTLTPAAFALGIGAGATYAIYTVFSKVATERHGADAALFWSFAFAAAALALIAPPHVPFMRAPQHAVLLVALGIVPTLIPYALYLTGLRALRASTASMLAAIEPVIAALLAAALLGERLAVLQAVGMALVVAAAVLLAWRAATER